MIIEKHIVTIYQVCTGLGLVIAFGFFTANKRIDKIKSEQYETLRAIALHMELQNGVSNRFAHELTIENRSTGAVTFTIPSSGTNKIKFALIHDGLTATESSNLYNALLWWKTNKESVK